MTTYNDNLTAVGSRLAAYSESTNTWVDKGDIAQVSLLLLPSGQLPTIPKQIAQ